MATKTFNFETTHIYEPELGHVINITGPSGNVEVNQGDTIVFKWSQKGGSPSNYQIGIGGFDSSVWSSTSLIYLNEVGDSISRTIKSNASFTTDSLNVTFSANGKTKTITPGVRVLNPNDSTPDSWNMGNQTSKAPGIEVYCGYVVVRGINVPVTCSINNSTYFSFRVNNGSWRTANTTVNSGDLVELRCNTPQAFSQTVTNRLTIGTVYDDISVTTGSSDSVQFIPSGITGLPIKFSEVFGFFGRRRQYASTDYEPAKLTDYLRGGDFLPNIAQNNGVPTSPPIRLSDFPGTGTSLYFDKYPSDKFAVSRTDTGSTTAEIEIGWEESVDYTLGYGLIRDNCQVRFNWQILNQEGMGEGVDVVLINGSQINTWQDIPAQFHYVGFKTRPKQNTEGFYTIGVTIEVRFRQDNSTIVESSATGTLSWYGP